MDGSVAYVFDNDGTLYSCPAAFDKAVTEKMVVHIARSASMSIGAILQRRQTLFKRYNIASTLLAFLREGFISDIDNFIQETYLAVNPMDYNIKPNPFLRKALERLNAPLYVHTNNPSVFAAKMLTYLGIRDLFTEIYGMFENESCQKPDHRAFQNVIKAVSPCKVWWYADNEEPNLIAAQQMGFKIIAVAESADTDKVKPDKRLGIIDELQ